MESTLVTIASAVFVLGLLIFVHELGHFTVAKLSGVAVLRFSLGFGPRLFGFRSGETEYVVSAFPLGGYVKMYGEEEGGEDGESEPDPATVGIDPSRSFAAKSLGKRLAIVLAGPFANIGFAWVCLLVAILGWGIERTSEEPLVGEVRAGMPAERAGLLTDDRILAIDGVEIGSWNALTEVIRSGDGKALTVDVARGETRLAVALTPEKKDVANVFGESMGEAYQIGITPALVSVEVGALEAPLLAAQQTWLFSKVIVFGLWKMISGDVSAKEIGGPLTIARIAGQQAQSGMKDLIGFMALLGVNLGILNLLPIPVLDGGHLVFLAFEAVFRRPLEGRPREVAQQVGLFLLVGLMVFAFYNDIARLVQGS